jgi:AcrR family transcriptional regulator
MNFQFICEAEPTMAQYLKDDVRVRIESAALVVFARRGFGRATMAAIAREAAISTGNVYRYFPDKDTLFRTVVPVSFARRLLKLVRARVKALEGVDEIRRLPPAAAFHDAAEELLAFCIANRLRVTVLLGRSAGTLHQGFTEALLQDLQTLAVAHFRGLNPALSLTNEERFALDRIYRNWASTLVDILETFEDDAGIRASVDAFSRYHLAGLHALLHGRPARSTASRGRNSA